MKPYMGASWVFWVRSIYGHFIEANKYRDGQTGYDGDVMAVLLPGLELTLKVADPLSAFLLPRRSASGSSHFEEDIVRGASRSDAYREGSQLGLGNVLLTISELP